MKYLYSYARVHEMVIMGFRAPFSSASLSMHTLNLRLCNTDLLDLHIGNRRNGIYIFRLYYFRQCISISILTIETLELYFVKTYMKCVNADNETMDSYPSIPRYAYAFNIYTTYFGSIFLIRICMGSVIIITNAVRY